MFKRDNKYLSVWGDINTPSNELPTISNKRNHPYGITPCRGRGKTMMRKGGFRHVA